jgi:diguanylate cyclase (GGDEF)-like protein/PAS domain S-box-containing protein
MSREQEDPQALFRALFESVSDSIVVIDEEGRVVLANPACDRLLGYAPAELAGQMVEVLVPERFRGHERYRAEYAKNPHPRPMGKGLALYALDAGGREVPVDIALAPIFVGGRHWAAAVLRDMRGRANGPETLRLQAAALRSAANGVVITDRTGTIIWVNPAACEITGYSANELIGQHTRLLKSGQHDRSFYERLWSTINRGETWSGTIINRRKDGTLYREEQMIAPVLDDGGDVSHFIAIKQDVSARYQAEDSLALAHSELAARVVEIEMLNRRLSEQATRDPLTNLYNRRHFEEVIARDAAHAVRAGTPLAILAFDIDQFKQVNDTHGHAAGDFVLQTFARMLSGDVRASDLVCRTGGEEFVVALPGITLPAAVECAEQWRTQFGALAMEAGSGAAVRCTVSIGVAMLRAGQETVDAALGRADAALYEAKRAGRDRVVSAEGTAIDAPRGSPDPSG